MGIGIPALIVSLVWINTGTQGQVIGFLTNHYEGCYNFQNLQSRGDFTHQRWHDHGSVDKCIHDCVTNEFIYGGLQFDKYYWFCYCDTNFYDPERNDYQCTTPCRDNTEQICGGGERGEWISVYKAKCSHGYWNVTNHQYPCSKQCGQCAGDADCDDYDGRCPSGCQHGWIGVKCDEREDIETTQRLTSTTTTSTFTSTTTSISTSTLDVNNKSLTSSIRPLTSTTTTKTSSTHMLMVNTIPHSSQKENSSVNVVMISVVVGVVVLVTVAAIVVAHVFWVKKSLKKQTQTMMSTIEQTDVNTDKERQDNLQNNQETGVYDEIRDVEDLGYEDVNVRNENVCNMREGEYVNVEVGEEGDFDHVTVKTEDDTSGRVSYQTLDMRDVTLPTHSVYASLSN